MLQSKRKSTVYIAFLIPFAFAVALVTYIVTDEKFRFNDAISIGVPLFFTLLILYLVYIFFLQMTSIVIDNDSISFKKPFSRPEKVYFYEIEILQLTGRIIGKNPFNNTSDGTTIKLKDGRVFYFADGTYSNDWALKTSLKNHVFDKKENNTFKEENISLSNISIQDSEIFKGNQFSAFSIIFWVSVATFLIILGLQHPENVENGIIPLLCILATWFLVDSFRMNYFILTHEFLIIKNHRFHFLNRTYLLKDIEEIVFDSGLKTSNYLKVTTKSFRNRIYQAKTLRTENWLALKKALESKNIKVRNECIVENKNCA